MPDIRSLLRTFTPEYALRNARREIVEHARIVAEVDALVERLNQPPASLEPKRRAS